MYKFLFNHKMITRDKDGLVSNIYNNEYEIKSSNVFEAYRQVPPSSFLVLVSSMDGEIIQDLRTKVSSEKRTERLLRKKIKQEGREALSKEEYSDAVLQGIIQ